MIRCGTCGRLWPKGTTWCGNCRKTLGTSICPEGHQNPVDVSCCTACGSQKLTPATPVQSLRPLTWVVFGIAVLAVLPLILSVLGGLLHALFCAVLNAVLPPLVGFAMLSMLASAMFGEQARRTIGSVWLALGRLVVQLLVLSVRFFSALIARIR